MWQGACVGGYIRVLCRDSVVVTLAQLTLHRSAVIKGELRGMLNDLHTQRGVCGQFMVASTAVCRPSAQSDGDARSRTPHGTIGVLVRARPCAVGAMGGTAVGSPVLHLLG